MTRKPEGGRNRSFEMDVMHAKGDFMEVYGLNHGLIYLLKDPRDPLLHIHLYESDAVEEVRSGLDYIKSRRRLIINKTDHTQHSVVYARSAWSFERVSNVEERSMNIVRRSLIRWWWSVYIFLIKFWFDSQRVLRLVTNYNTNKGLLRCECGRWRGSLAPE